MTDPRQKANQYLENNKILELFEVYIYTLLLVVKCNSDVYVIILTMCHCIMIIYVLNFKDMGVLSLYII